MAPAATLTPMALDADVGNLLHPPWLYQRNGIVTVRQYGTCLNEIIRQNAKDRFEVPKAVGQAQCRGMRAAPGF